MKRHVKHMLFVTILVIVAALGLMAFAPFQTVVPPDGGPAPVGSNFLGAVVGVLISVAFSYFPGLNTWYTAQSGDKRGLIMLGVLLVVTLGLYGLSCAGVRSDFACTQGGLVQALTLFGVTAFANQGTYLLLPQPKPAVSQPRTA